MAVKVSTEPLRLSASAPLSETLAALSKSDDMENQLVELQAYRRLGFGARNSSIPKFFESGEGHISRLRFQLLKQYAKVV